MYLWITKCSVRRWKGNLFPIRSSGRIGVNWSVELRVAKCGELWAPKTKSFLPSTSFNPSCFLPNLLAALCRPRCGAPAVSTPHCRVNGVGVRWEAPECKCSCGIDCGGRHLGQAQHKPAICGPAKRCALVFPVLIVGWIDGSSSRIPTLRDVGVWINAGGFWSGPGG